MASGKVMIMVTLVVMFVSTEAQVPPDMSCIQALTPCTQFLNATNPPAACCGPLKEAFATQLPCLCSVFQNPSLGGAFDFNMTQAMELPSKCGLGVSDPNICNKGHKAASAPAPAAGVPPTTASPGSSTASSVAWAGPFSGLMLLLAGLMFY